MRESEQAIYDQIDRQLGRPATAVMTIDDAATTVLMRHRVIRFRDNAMIKVQKPYMHFASMDKEAFDQIAYPLIGGISRNRMSDTFAYLRGTAENFIDNDRYILFGAGTNYPTVWDMEKLEMRTDVLPDDCVWRSPYTMKEPAFTHRDKPIPFILSLAGGNTGLYSDIMQSFAPLLMARKPDGVIWWTGDGTDDKLAIINALHKIFPNQLSAISVKQLIGGRSNTPLLNGVLGNIAEDSGQITDTEIYKNIGTHQNFRVHKYHSQHGIEIRGNVHHIFSANNAPNFITKSLSAQWRTHVIPFSEQLGSEPPPTITDDFLGRLIGEMCRYAVRIKQQGYVYRWSGAGMEGGKPKPALGRPDTTLPEFRW
jgi:hypothetical protein